MSINKRILDWFFGNRVDLAPYLSREIEILRRFAEIFAEGDSHVLLAAKMDDVLTIEYEFGMVHEELLGEAVRAGYLTYDWQDMYDLSVAAKKMISLINSYYNRAMVESSEIPHRNVFQLEKPILTDFLEFLGTYRVNPACARVILQKCGNQIKEMSRQCRDLIHRGRRGACASETDQLLIHQIELINGENERIHDRLNKLSIVSF